MGLYPDMDELKKASKTANKLDEPLYEGVPRKDVLTSPYLDEVQAVKAEVARASVEGRDPELDEFRDSALGGAGITRNSQHIRPAAYVNPDEVNYNPEEPPGIDSAREHAEYLKAKEAETAKTKSDDYSDARMIGNSEGPRSTETSQSNDAEAVKIAASKKAEIAAESARNHNRRSRRK